MKLELGIMAGAESKAFLVDLTKIVERFEKVARTLRSEEEIKAAGGLGEDEEVEDEELEVQPKKRGPKKKAKAVEEDEENEEDDLSSDDAPDSDKSEEKEKPAKRKAKSFDDMDEDESEEEEAPKKSAKSKKITIDDVNDACMERATRTKRAEVLAILKKFGVKSVTDLDEEDYSDVIKAMQSKK